jgi:hypothetical protein
MIDPETRNRIRVAVAAYAYEIENDPIISDAEFDALCLAINPQVDTGNPVTDKFFREEFDPNTGSWVHRHPNKEGLAQIAAMHRKSRDAP